MVFQTTYGELVVSYLGKHIQKYNLYLLLETFLIKPEIISIQFLTIDCVIIRCDQNYLEKIKIDLKNFIKNTEKLINTIDNYITWEADQEGSLIALYKNCKIYYKIIYNHHKEHYELLNEKGKFINAFTTAKKAKDSFISIIENIRIETGTLSISSLLDNLQRRYNV